MFFNRVLPSIHPSTHQLEQSDSDSSIALQPVDWLISLINSLGCWLYSPQQQQQRRDI